MARPSDAHLELARRLLVHVREDDGAQAAQAPLLQVHDALFQTLAPIIGAAGFRAVFARSVKLARSDYPGLQDVRIQEDAADVAAQVAAALVTLAPALASESAAGVLGTFFALMTTFIGEALVEKLVRRAYPAIDDAGPEVTE